MGAVENVKEIANLIGKFHDIELNRRILKLEEEVLDLSRDKRRSEERVEELERALKFKAELEFREPFFWMKGDPVPYCPRCWEEKRVGVHITYSHRNSHGEYWDCKSCGAQWTTHGLSNKPY
jgi:hypothetical protein